MSQNDFNIANQGFPSFRSDLNSALQALASCSSGSAAPTATYANMLWMDTANNKLKVRNEDNDDWIDLFDLNQTADTAMLAGVTATVAELNVLDGITSSTAELNILDGITASTAELNVLDGITGIASQAEALGGTNNSTLMTPLRVAQAARPAFATAVASTSGTAVDFTGIPSWVRRVTVMFTNVSTNGTSAPLIQIGTSSGFASSGYLGSGADVVGATASAYAVGFGIGTAISASAGLNGSVVIENLTGNTWVARGQIGRSDTGQTYLTAGSVALAAALDRVRVTTNGGTNTFDAGTLNISWE